MEIDIKFREDETIRGRRKQKTYVQTRIRCKTKCHFSHILLLPTLAQLGGQIPNFKSV